jgi:ribose-phosphate pyrophosphokinase
MENTVKIYTTATASILGEKIAKCIGQPLRQIHSERFSDGEIFVRFNESVRGQTVFLISKVNMPMKTFLKC